jgi:hypothetical protein
MEPRINTKYHEKCYVVRAYSCHFVVIFLLFCIFDPFTEFFVQTYRSSEHERWAASDIFFGTGRMPTPQSERFYDPDLIAPKTSSITFLASPKSMRVFSR